MKINANGSGSVHRLVLAAALSISLGFGTHASAVDYSYLIDLKTGIATSLGNVEARAINDAGQVVGTNSNNHAFITGPNGMGMTDLGTLGGDSFSVATGVNAAGRVVGYSDSTGGRPHAFITGPNGMGMTDLPGTIGQSNSQPAGINVSGQVVGISGEFPEEGFITGPNGVGRTDLGYLTAAYSINDAGQVVGGGPALPHGFITGPDGVGMTDLDTPDKGLIYSLGVDINASGQVVGNFAISLPGLNSDRLFITGPNGAGITYLSTLGGYDGAALGINDAGQVAGWSDTANGQQHAFVTGPNGVGITDLNSLVHLPAGVVLDSAIGINNMGQVIASVSVVPEPESYALMLAGLALMGVMVRRKQKGRCSAEEGRRQTVVTGLARYRVRLGMSTPERGWPISSHLLRWQFMTHSLCFDRTYLQI